MSGTVWERLDDVESRLAALQKELVEIRRLAGAAEAEACSVDPAAARPPSPDPTPPAPEPASPPAYWPPPRPAQAGQRATPPPAAATRPAAVRVSTSLPSAGDVLGRLDLMGPRGLAVAGGIVMLLGIAFFYVLAANRGWIGPIARVSFGVVASSLVFAAGVVLRRRYGQLHAAVAAVGVGIGGGYTTLLAATALYDLVPRPAAMACAAGIAAAGLVVALVWSSELLASLGMVGAIGLAGLEAIDSGSSATGVAFVAIMTAAAAVVSVVRRWPWL